MTLDIYFTQVYIFMQKLPEMLRFSIWNSPLSLSPSTMHSHFQV